MFAILLEKYENLRGQLTCTDKRIQTDVNIQDQGNQGFVNGGFQTVVRALSGEIYSLPPFNLIKTPFLASVVPRFNQVSRLLYLSLTSF